MSDSVEERWARVATAAAAGGATPEEIAGIAKYFQPEIRVLDCTNEEAGMWLRWFGDQALRSLARNRESDPETFEMQLGLITLGLLRLISDAHESNAGSLDFTLDGVTLDGEDTGSWRVSLERVAAHPVLPEETDGTVDVGGL